MPFGVLECLPHILDSGSNIFGPNRAAPALDLWNHQYQLCNTLCINKLRQLPSYPLGFPRVHHTALASDIQFSTLGCHELSDKITRAAPIWGTESFGDPMAIKG